METALAAIPLKTNRGTDATLADYAGQVLLVVNVASKCGLTPHYAGLQALYDAYRAQGFAVLAFPANDFAGQEPGSDAEIATFCTSQYDVTFPLFAKTAVTGADRHPLFAALTGARPDTQGEGPMRERLRGYGMPVTDRPEVLWNFEKFVIGRDGSPVARFSPDTTPDDPALVATIERALAEAR